MRDLFVTVEFVKGAARYVMSAEAPADLTAAGPLRAGQKGAFFTFLVAGVPRSVSPEAAAKRIADGFDARGSRPGVEWHVAYSIPWARLRDSGVEAAEPGIGLEEAVERSGRLMSSLERAMGQGRLPVTRPLKPGGGWALSQVNPADLAAFLERYPLQSVGWPKGRLRGPRKKG
ncbi:MAG: hypothetical protein LBQ12_13720 [Deltaproteobacteria bacterium]|nr:hypothetical protein [Deltaproteobacteria bacterium]